MDVDFLCLISLNFDPLGGKMINSQMTTRSGFLPQNQESSLQEEKK